MRIIGTDSDTLLFAAIEPGRWIVRPGTSQENAMRRTITTAFFSLALGGVVLGAALPASPVSAANVTVGIGEGGAVFGYNDGYWDRDHRWHKWRDEREATEWRRDHHEHYYDWKHNRDRDEGWRDHDRYWEHD
jgi:hypothetical protein